MVYNGPSKGCQICRKRRVRVSKAATELNPFFDIRKCDLVRPACGNCVRRKQVCTGYRDDFDALHKDQTQAVAEKIIRKELNRAVTVISDGNGT